MIPNTRRQLAHRAEELDLPDGGHLVDRFLWAAFGNRSQPWRRGRIEDDGHPTHASVAEELHTTLRVSPSDDIADLLLLLFALQHARSRRHLVEFSLNGWLAFRDLAPNRATGCPPAGSETICRRYLDGGPGAVGWADLAESVSVLAGLDWTHHPGYRDFCALAAQTAAGPAAAPDGLPDRFRPAWDLTRERLRSRRPWWREVSDRFRPCCADASCFSRNSVDKAKRVLADYRPVICGFCGAVNVPSRLAREYEARHVHPA